MLVFIRARPFPDEDQFGMRMALGARRSRLATQLLVEALLLSAGGAVAGIVLVVLGIILLLHTLHLFDLEYLARYWPVLLIAAGVYLLYNRFTGHRSSEEVGHER